MTTTVEAVYEKGTLKLVTALPLPEKARVLVTIETASASNQDGERAAWLQLSEEALTKTWDNPADDVFKELLEK